MAIIRAQVGIQHVSALPEDVLVNTLYATVGSLDDVTYDEIKTAIVNLYNAGATPLYTFMSTEVAQNGHTIKLYNMDELPPRVPVKEYSFNLPVAPNGDPLPGEVALVMSFQGDKVSGEAQARKRGRIYLGRFDKDSVTAGRPSAALLNSVDAAGTAFLAASSASAFWSWCVYSPTSDLEGDPTPFTLVTNGWVDNAFDTQRRRGLAPTAKQLFP